MCGCAATTTDAISSVEGDLVTVDRDGRAARFTRGELFPFTAGGASIEFRGMVVRFRRPSGPGGYRLESLGALACESEGVCTPLAGELRVRELTLPCARAACGRFDGDVVVASDSVHGQLHLFYRDTDDGDGDGAHHCFFAKAGDELLDL
jgi:hypothetical protein